MFVIRSATAEEVDTVDQILSDIAPHLAGHPMNLAVTALFEVMTSVLAEIEPEAQVLLVRAIRDELPRRFPAAKGN